MFFVAYFEDGTRQPFEAEDLELGKDHARDLERMFDARCSSIRVQRYQGTYDGEDFTEVHPGSSCTTYSEVRFKSSYSPIIDEEPVEVQTVMGTTATIRRSDVGKPYLDPSYERYWTM